MSTGTSFLGPSKHLISFSNGFCIYNCLSLVNVSEVFTFSGDAFQIITPVYEKDVWCVVGMNSFCYLPKK